MIKGGLGKGLSSLIPQKHDAPSAGAVLDVSNADERIVHISVDSIRPNPHQPRREFHPEELNELAESIRQYGVIQPIIVTRADGGYQLIAGERRLRASKAAGLREIPALVRTAHEQEQFELALIENIQRADLSPIEEAYGYARLMDDYGMTQEEVAKRMGKSRSVVANTVRLLNLPDDIQRALTDNRISMSMARVLAGMDVSSEQRSMFERMLKGDFTVREAEHHAQQKGGGRQQVSKDPHVAAMEADLREALGTRVTISKRGDTGQVVISFYSGEELASIVREIAKKH